MSHVLCEIFSIFLNVIFYPVRDPRTVPTSRTNDGVIITLPEYDSYYMISKVTFLNATGGILKEFKLRHLVPVSVMSQQRCE